MNTASNREPSQELLRRRDVMAWQKIPRSELDSWCELYPEIVFVKRSRSKLLQKATKKTKVKKRKAEKRGCGRYYRKSVIKAKILGMNGDYERGR